MTKYLSLFLLLSNVIYSQHSGRAEYSVLIGKDSLYQSQDVLKNLYNDAMINSQKLSFLLDFKGNESLFRLKEKSIAENIEFTLATVNYATPIYTNNKTGEKLYTSDDNEFLITDFMVTDWTLTSETKMIDKYLCYKATSIHQIVNPVGTFEYPVIAWFCPQIPVPFGPIGYGKLPGLILELQRRNFVYGIKSISLDSEKIEIKKPSKGKKISAAELNIKLIESARRSREDFERSKE